MIDAFLISFFNTFALLIWFKTHAFIEYFKYFPTTSKIIKSYKDSIKAGINMDFINFLSLNYDSFLIRLLTCPFCLNFWISIVTSFFVGYEFFALIYTSSMIYYKIVNILTKYERN
jgi:hypothetical protein